MMAAVGSESTPALPPGIDLLDWKTYRNRWRWCVEPEEEVGGSPAGPTLPTLDCSEQEEVQYADPLGRAPTCPIVRNAEAAWTEAANVARSFVPGEGSLYFGKWPGVGGTTAFARHAVESLGARSPGWDVGVAILCLPRRGLVEEKAAMTRQYVEDRDLDVLVLPLLGKSPDEDSGWLCGGEYFQKRASLHRELNRSACVGCPASDLCEDQAGCYRYERRRVLDMVADAKRGDGPPVLLVTTHAMLPTIWGDLPKRVPIVLDEAGTLFGLATELDVPWSELDTARKKAGEFIQDQKRLGNTIRSENEHWRRWIEAAPAREAATVKLRSEVTDAKDEVECRGSAVQWAETCRFSRSRVQELVSKHWPDKKRVVRALQSYARAQDSLPDVLAADLVKRILRLLQKQPSTPRRKSGAGKENETNRISKGEELPAFAKWLQRQELNLKNAVEKLPEEYQRALVEGQVRPPRTGDGLAAWPWEEVRESDGEDLRPAFASIAIRIAREALEARAPVIIRKRRVVHLMLPDRELVDRISAGYVAWIAVGPMPAEARDALEIREEYVQAEPEGLRVVVLSRVGREGKWLGFGPGDRIKVVKGKRIPFPSWQDEATRDLAVKLAEKAESGTLSYYGRSIKSFAAVLHKVDWDALGQPGWSRYYNAGHQGTDDFEDGEMLLVRRWTLPFRECILQAEVLRRVLGIHSPEDVCGLVDVESRRWWYGSRSYGEEIGTACLADPLERGLQRFHELQAMLNAIGRCRPLSAGPEGRVVILLNGRPLEGLKVTEGPLDVLSPGVVDMLGIQVELPSEEERERVRQAREEHCARRVVERQEQLLALLGDLAEAGQPVPSQRQLAALLGTSPRTLCRDLEELGSRGDSVLAAGPVAELKARLRASLWELQESLSRQSKPGGRDPAGGEMSGVRHGPPSCLIEAVPHAGHFDPNQLSARELGLLPGTSSVRDALTSDAGSTPADRTIRRHLALIRDALLGDVLAILPRRSDQRRTFTAVVDACVKLLEPRHEDQPMSAPRIETPLLPFDHQAEVAEAAAVTAQDQLLPEAVAPSGDPLVGGAESDPQPTGSSVETGDSPWLIDGLCEDCVEALEERAAILEFDAGFTRQDAERRALEMVLGFPGAAEPVGTRCA